MPRTKAFRAALLHCLADPREVGVEASYEYFEDGLLLVEDGKVARLGAADDLLSSLPAGTALVEYPDALITPGFIDTHIHYPQVGVMGSYGTQLLDWLETYTFPNEGRFADPEHAREQAKLFLEELLRNGTTTALVFGTVHKQSVDAFFEAAEKLDLRMIAGKVLMDRNAPDYLTDTPETGYADSRELIERWHGKGRLHYAVTPRFAPTSSPEQLALAGKLLGEFPDLYLHTHISENRQEVEWVRSLFPERRGYLDVYDHHGLVGARSVFAHGLHLCDDECRRLGEAGSAVAFCPTSNLFLGSGLLDLARLEAHGVRVGLGTDVGGGTSFSQLTTLSEAYKVLQLQGQKLDPFKALYLATLGGAQALYLDQHIGNLQPGKDADFVVLDYQATPLIAHRLAQATSLPERLFALMMLGDDRAVRETFAAGVSVHRR
ncbi:guanine deaminase [Stutzerimonas nosocomialis]|uniref:Guanine deaminase n=1 Tax=Stutzerimonas nosocomialis TaxID=1056496 RepID=A0A5R9QW07_9GAMM|nr:guanine deaminase [Stutzerimonas nosocomialis]TLX63405.1 guanine deaminase [Stutzerimonas nosocomialis]